MEREPDRGNRRRNRHRISAAVWRGMALKGSPCGATPPAGGTRCSRFVAEGGTRTRCPRWERHWRKRGVSPVLTSCRYAATWGFAAGLSLSGGGPLSAITGPARKWFPGAAAGRNGNHYPVASYNRRHQIQSASHLSLTKSPAGHYGAQKGKPKSSKSFRSMLCRAAGTHPDRASLARSSVCKLVRLPKESLNQSVLMWHINAGGA